MTKRLKPKQMNNNLGSPSCMDCQKLLLIVAELRRTRLGIRSLPSNVRRSVLALAQQGRTQKNIAEKFGISRSTVSKWLVEEGISTQHRNFRAKEPRVDLYRAVLLLLRTGHGILETSRKANVNHTTVRRWAVKAGIETDSQRLYRERRERNNPPESNL